MTTPAAPTICLTMIVRDEAHIIHEALAAAAPRIDRWVIVDTGSTDGTPELVERLMAEHGVPGELHHRPWRDFATNRTESLQLAAGVADYSWVLDADDTVEGDLDFSGLTADSYLLQYVVGHRFWRRQVFRSALPWRYEGVLHEYPVCDAPASEARLPGDYVVHGRKLGARSADPRKYERDAEILRAEVERYPEDARSWFYLGQSLADAGDPAGALAAYRRRVELGGWDEERALSLIRSADALLALERPWEEAVATLLEAYETRPTRAEPFALLARGYRMRGRPHLGHTFASRAAELPYPVADGLFVDAGVYAWGAREEQAVCAHQIGRFGEAADLTTDLLSGTALPEGERERVAANRDAALEQVREERCTAPVPPSRRPRYGRAVAAHADVTVTVLARDPRRLERTLTSLQHCCEDLDRVARFVCVGPALASVDTRGLVARHPFLELRLGTPDALGPAMDDLAATVTTPRWLLVEDRWEFVSRSRILERASAILDQDPRVVQVALNRSYATTLAERSLAGGELREVAGRRYRVHEHVPPGGPEWDAYLERLGAGVRTNAHWPHFTFQPSLIDVARLRGVGGFAETGDVEHEFGRRCVEAGLVTAYFDEVTCLPAASSSPEDEAPAAVEPPVGRAPEPVRLGTLAADVRIGELELDLTPPLPVLSAAVVPDGAEGIVLVVRTGEEGGTPVDHLVRLGPDLMIESVDVPPADAPTVGPLLVETAAGRLTLERLDGGGVRLVRGDGATVPFSVTDDPAEEPFALAAMPGGVLLLFGIHAERLGVAMLENGTLKGLLASAK